MTKVQSRGRYKNSDIICGGVKNDFISILIATPYIMKKWEKRRKKI
jgi:hypothetical protein